jgi:hypothetical protein
VAAALGAQPLKLLALVRRSSLAHEIRMRIVSWTRLRTLGTRDRKSLLREMRAGEMVREIRGGENQGTV